MMRSLTRVLLISLLSGTSVQAQPAAFGSADDPSESPSRTRWRSSLDIELRGGFSLIGSSWRTAAGGTAEYFGPNLGLRLDGTLRGGVDGVYKPDVDGFYDVLRAIDFVRVTPEPAGVHLRAGPTNRMRLGTGHVVNFFSSETVWDDRTVAMEAYWPGRVFDLAAFSDDVRINRVVGGRVVLRPLFWAREERARSFEMGASYVTDRREIDGRALLSSYSVDLRFTAANVGDIMLQPFAVFSAYENAGSGVGFGGEFASDNFIDIARFRVRLALYLSSDEFIPGYVGSLYRVNNLDARILKSEDFEADSAGAVVGTPLTDAESGTAFETEIRLLFFDQFELWYSFRRHFGGDPLSESHLRLFFRTGRIAAQISQDRGGLRSFFSLFNDLGDQTSLHFRTDYHVSGGLWIFVRAIYSYERGARAADGSERYIVQRR
ncbi:MAG: hypothetical protein R3178_05280, partial [Rhodothermales bacterium]|nr:hypothetical protein [Rhodothermales bacterium]